MSAPRPGEAGPRDFGASAVARTQADHAKHCGARRTAMEVECARTLRPEGLASTVMAMNLEKNKKKSVP